MRKPLTLTRDEGIKIGGLPKTGGVFRSVLSNDLNGADKFLPASRCHLCHLGMAFGDNLQAPSSAGAIARQGGPFKTDEPPANLDWNMWLGQASDT